MSDIKKITWGTTVVPTVKLSEWLTEKNFQPGKFHLLPDPSGAFQTVVIHVVKEEEIDGDQ